MRSWRSASGRSDPDPQPDVGRRQRREQADPERQLAFNRLREDETGTQMHDNDSCNSDSAGQTSVDRRGDVKREGMGDEVPGRRP
jgi:hypothetical protein